MAPAGLSAGCSPAGAFLTRKLNAFSARKLLFKTTFFVLFHLTLSVCLVSIRLPEQSWPSLLRCTAAAPGASTSVGPAETGSGGGDNSTSAVSNKSATKDAHNAKAGESAASSSLPGGESEDFKDRESLRLWNVDEAEAAEIKNRLASMRIHAGSLTDKFMENVARLTAQIDILRLEVNKAKGEIQRLNESFDDQTEETLRVIDNRSAEFIRGLSLVEDQLDEQLQPPSGVVYRHLQDLRNRLTEIRVAAEKNFHTEASSVMQQIDTCSAKVDDLTRLYFEMRRRMDVEVSDIDTRLISARHELEDLVQERLNQLGASEQRITAEAMKRLREFLQNLHLEENMLQDIVQNIQREFLEPSAFPGAGAHREKGATYIDLSSYFSSSKIEKVCSVMSHLVKQLLPGKTVIPIFIHTVPQPSTSNPPTRESGGKLFGGLGSARALFASLNLGPPGWAGSEDKKGGDEKRQSEVQIAELILPDEQVIATVAAEWLRERQRSGPVFQHYAVVRVEGLLAEAYTVPYLQPLHFDYAKESRFSLARVDQFGEKLEKTIHEKLGLLTEALEKNTYLLVAYLGEAAGDVKPQPSLAQTKSRIATARRLLQHVKAPSLGAYFHFEQFKQQLRFLDELAKVFTRNQKKHLASKVVLPGDDIEISVVVGGKGAPGGKLKIAMPPCRQGDPFFQHAFTILSMQLTALTPQVVVFPNDALLARTLSTILEDLRGNSTLDEERGGKPGQRAPTCGATITSSGVAKRFWRPEVLKVSMSYMEKHVSPPNRKNERGPALRNVPVVKDSTHDVVKADLKNGFDDLAKYTTTAIARVLRDRLDASPRGYTLYVVVNVKE
uniref:Putative microtubule-binding protein n=1 Tax=Toxoplasma gondii COUG TaxID=1074873 RepID=A0A2G8YAV9_TOXGO|nr:putative microtubule-binding protein [Toxoplasma gondii COUG]